ncbi:MAG: tyrosine-type recombinase/integrase [Syntrophaceae bacterium]|nr:tyrosine-type recombinase/integrase [Syntrophaceae bacterium]
MIKHFSAVLITSLSFVPYLIRKKTTRNMKATLRKRPAANGRQALYLDIYPPAPHPVSGRMTRKHALGISVIAKPRSAQERAATKASMALAQSIQAKIQLRLQAQDYGFLIHEQQTPLAPYFREIAKKALTNKRLYTRSLALVQEYYGMEVTMQSMTPKVLNEFRAKLLKRYANNAAAAYYSKLLQVLKNAHEEGLLINDPLKNVERIRLTQGEIVYLEAEEINALIETECESEDLKKAFLLSCETGLRRCDAEKLEGENFTITADGPELRITQKKTKTLLTIPITWELHQYLGLPRKGRLFRGVHQRAYDGTLTRWIERAGITKKITYHKSRHTCGTQLIANDVNLKTTQELLGHKSISSTMIYAHVVDKKKREAIERKKIVGTKKENQEKNSNIDM